MNEQQDDPSKKHRDYSVQWYTPAQLLRPIISALSWVGLSGDEPQWGDPCTGPDALAYQAAQGLLLPAWHLEQDALSEQWADLPLFVNPPFGREMGLWAARCAAHTRATILLTPSSTDVAWWAQAHRAARAVIFLRGRMRFIDGRARAEGIAASGHNTKGTTLFLFYPEQEGRTNMRARMTAASLEAWCDNDNHIWQPIHRRNSQ